MDAVEINLPPDYTLDRVRAAVSRKSVVPSGRHSNKEGYTGPPREYDSTVIQMGYRVIQDPVAFAEIKKEFDSRIDKKTGKTLTQLSKEYWEKKRREGKI